MNTLNLLEQLRGGQFDAAIGKFESVDLECKRTPYQLDTEKDKFELIKDVCALGNARGGYLLIGFATTRDQAHSDDRIGAVQPFLLSDFKESQYRQLVESWTWPSLSIEIELVKDQADPKRGIAIIKVPAVSEDMHPVLTVGVVGEASGKRNDKVVGLFERSRSHTRNFDARQLHTWIVAGRRHEGLLKEELAAINASLDCLKQNISRAQDSPLANTPPDAEAIEEKTPFDSEAISTRVSLALDAANLNHKPSFVLIGVPHTRLLLQELMESQNSRLSRLVSDPPQLRDGGFSISAGFDTQLVSNRSRRARIPAFSVLELHRNGFALYAVTGDEEGLCWAMAPRGLGQLQINPRALVEMTYLFVRFLFEAYKENLSADQSFDVACRLQSVEGDPLKYKLQVGYGTLNSAPQWRMDCSVAATLNDSPGRVTYSLLTDLYAQFGIEAERIPFLKENAHGQKEVDPKLILAS